MRKWTGKWLWMKPICMRSFKPRLLRKRVPHIMRHLIVINDSNESAGEYHLSQSNSHGCVALASTTTRCDCSQHNSLYRSWKQSTSIMLKHIWENSTATEDDCFIGCCSVVSLDWVGTALALYVVGFTKMKLEGPLGPSRDRPLVILGWVDGMPRLALWGLGWDTRQEGQSLEDNNQHSDGRTIKKDCSCWGRTHL